MSVWILCQLTRLLRLSSIGLVAMATGLGYVFCLLVVMVNRSVLKCCPLVVMVTRSVCCGFHRRLVCGKCHICALEINDLHEPTTFPRVTKLCSHGVPVFRYNTTILSVVVQEVIRIGTAEKCRDNICVCANVCLRVFKVMLTLPDFRCQTCKAYAIGMFEIISKEVRYCSTVLSTYMMVTSSQSLLS